MSKILTPAMLWKNYDKPERDLNITVIHSSEKNGKIYTELYFDGRLIENAVTRIFCKSVYSKDYENKPVMIIVNGFREQINDEALDYWSDNGYIAISPDYCGCGNNSTIYPQAIDYCNADNIGRHMDYVDTTADETAWYNWAYTVRRTISYAAAITSENSPIYMYGIHEACKIVMMVLGEDKRIKAGALLFGTVWDSFENTEANSDNEEVEEILKHRIEKEEERERMLAGISPQTYASLIEMPVYIVEGTNNNHTDMLNVFECALRMINEGHTDINFEMRMTDSFNTSNRDLLRQWFDNAYNSYLNINEIKLQAEIRDNKLFLQADLNNIKGVNDVNIYYSRGEMNQCIRNWVKAKNGVYLFDKYEAEIEITDIDMPITAICNIVSMGKKVSSKPFKFIPSQIGEVLVVEKKKLIYKGKQGTADFLPLNPFIRQTLEFVKDNPVTEKIGAYDVSGVCGKNLSTYCLNDPMYIIGEGSALTFDVYTNTSCELNVYISTDWGNDNVTIFRSQQKLVGGNLWQKIFISFDEFKAMNGGKQLKENLKDMLLTFSAENEIILNNILFT